MSDKPTTSDLVKRLRDPSMTYEDYACGESSLARQAADALEAAERVIAPFANTVFNDNGDVTVSTSNLQIHDYFAAYKWLARHATGQRKGGDDAL